MDDLQNLIQKILQEHQDSELFRDNVYTDSPILYTASQMAGYTPPIYRRMRALAGNEAEYFGETSRRRIFYKQAQFMADYEDNCPYTGDYCCYYPTYQQMNIAQLRGYFTWRAAVRRGEAKPGCSSFKFLYIYELLALVGADSPDDAFEKLVHFWQTYRQFDHWMDSYLQAWLCEFAAYYNLPPARLQGIVDTGFEDALYRFIHSAELPDAAGKLPVTDAQLLQALSVLSSYNPLHSRMYRLQPERYTRLLCSGLRAYLRHTQKNNKLPLSEKLFGYVCTLRHEMFNGAVFYDTRPPQETEYVLHEYLRYTCHGGQWYCTRLYGQRCKNHQLGLLIKNMEAHIRERLDFSPPLKSGKTSRVLLRLLDKEIDTLLQEEQLAREAEQAALAAQKHQQMLEATRLNTDLLAEIRRSADATRDKLLADLPPEENADPVPEPSAAAGAFAPGEAAPPAGQVSGTLPSGEAPASTAPADTPFTPAEQSFLQALLAVQTQAAPYADVTAAARSAGLTPDLLVDAINEKLLDILGDTAISFEEGKPVLLEDYLAELSALVRQA